MSQSYHSPRNIQFLVLILRRGKLFSGQDGLRQAGELSEFEARDASDKCVLLSLGRARDVRFLTVCCQRIQTDS